MQADFSRKLRMAVSHERLDGYTLRGATGGDDNLFLTMLDASNVTFLFNPSATQYPLTII